MKDLKLSTPVTHAWNYTKLTKVWGTFKLKNAAHKMTGWVEAGNQIYTAPLLEENRK